MTENGIREDLLPEAARELDAMASVAEEAAERILTAVEKIDELRDGMSESVSEAVGDAIIEIFEACGFQDLTGQRVGRIHKTLDGVADRVEAVMSHTGHGDGDASSEAKRNRDKHPKNVGKSGSEPFSEEGLLNGPQLPSDAKSQEEIDALMDQLNK
ncbi:protein phosphatase CheZ [Nisaea sp.]|uniref:protein phosphatase CheZ n=1 Tax=Nisaea sp. TaxID=2024842 RepID=UPI003265BFEA